VDSEEFRLVLHADPFCSDLLGNTEGGQIVLRILAAVLAAPGPERGGFRQFFCLLPEIDAK